MKKIIATVLAMVMALALCTVAFAADVEYTSVDQNGTASGSKYTVEAVDGKYKVSNTSNTVDHYIVKEVGGSWVGYYVAADKSDYDCKLSADGKADLYLTYAGDSVAAVTYKAKAAVYTNIGDGCAQLTGTKSNTYYKATWEENDETQIKYYVKSTSGENLLVDGKLVKATLANTDGELNGHTWKAASYDKNDNVATYKCKDCGTVATVYKTKDAAAASGAAIYVRYPANGATWIAYTDGSTTTPSTDTNKSPKTFDAGIAMYVGMALTSVAGSAVVIGKKKEF